MFASSQSQRRSARSPHITDVFERASLSILRRYQRAAGAAVFAGSDGPDTALPSQARHLAPEINRTS